VDPGAEWRREPETDAVCQTREFKLWKLSAGGRGKRNIGSSRHYWEFVSLSLAGKSTPNLHFQRRSSQVASISPSYFVTQNEEPNSQFRTRHPFYTDDDTFRHSGEVMLIARSIRHKLL
jgi:hypothetical protein